MSATPSGAQAQPEPTANRVLRRSEGVCTECVRRLPASVEADSSNVFLSRTCPDHGLQRTLLSHHPGYYEDLDRFYFTVMDRPLAQRDYLVRLTERCNLTCPICLAGANAKEEGDLPADRLYDLIRRSDRKLKIDLMAAEPTLRDDLTDMVREVRRHGHIAAVHTNGLKLVDRGYVHRLKEAGVSEVFLQFDGFDEEAYLALRGRKLLDVKLRALDNLRTHGLATNLTCVVMRGLNEEQVGPILDFGTANDFVKEVFFLGCRSLGYARATSEPRTVMPDELIDIVEEQTDGRLRRDDVQVFQKLYFALLGILGVRKCFYVQHYVVLRSGTGYEPISSVLPMDQLDRALDSYREWAETRRQGGSGPLSSLMAGPPGDGIDWAAGAALAARLAGPMARPSSLPLLLDALRLNALLATGFDLSQVRRKMVLVGYITACDPEIMDYDISRFCGKGEISVDLGYRESGAEANIDRERQFQADGLAGPCPGE